MTLGVAHKWRHSHLWTTPIGSQIARQSLYVFLSLNKLYFREIFDSILREVKGNLGLDVDEDDSSATNFAELVAKLVDILTTKLTTKTKERNCVIALSNAEILRHLDSFLLPGKTWHIIIFTY